MKKASALFLALALLCALLFSGCTDGKGQTGGNVTDSPTLSPAPSQSVLPTMPEESPAASPTPSGAVKPDGSQAPDLLSPSPSSDPSGSAAPDAAGSP